ncbi:MAG: YqgE/AlgH family protein [Natronospirillum sp.]
MPQLTDAYFAQSIVYLVRHDADGAMGLIVNKPVGMTLTELLDNSGVPHRDVSAEPELVFGGPVMRERGFVLHGLRGEWDSTLNNDTWGVTTSKDILHSIAQGQGPEQYQICLGYAGWEAGQLEHELAENAWLMIPAEADLVFATPPYERYQAAINRLGIDFNQLGAGGTA